MCVSVCPSPNVQPKPTDQSHSNSIFRVYVCVCSNANPLHYYVLRVPRKADRWRWVWSIFNSRTAWADHITCGTSICIVYWRKLRLGWLYVLLFVYSNCVVWADDERKGEGEIRCRLIACSSRKARLNVPIRQTNRYKEYYMPSQHTYCGRCWNLSKHVMYNPAIRKCTSPPLLAPRLKIFKWKFTTPPGIEPRTHWTRGRHATSWASAASSEQTGEKFRMLYWGIPLTFYTIICTQYFKLLNS